MRFDVTLIRTNAKKLKSMEKNKNIFLILLCDNPQVFLDIHKTVHKTIQQYSQTFLGFTTVMFVI